MATLVQSLGDANAAQLHLKRAARDSVRQSKSNLKRRETDALAAEHNVLDWAGVLVLVLLCWTGNWNVNGKIQLFDRRRFVSRGLFLVLCCFVCRFGSRAPHIVNRHINKFVFSNRKIATVGRDTIVTIN